MMADGQESATSHCQPQRAENYIIERGLYHQLQMEVEKDMMENTRMIYKPKALEEGQPRAIGEGSGEVYRRVQDISQGYCDSKKPQQTRNSRHAVYRL